MNSRRCVCVTEYQHPKAATKVVVYLSAGNNTAPMVSASPNTDNGVMWKRHKSNSWFLCVGKGGFDESLRVHIDFVSALTLCTSWLHMHQVFQSNTVNNEGAVMWRRHVSNVSTYTCVKGVCSRTRRNYEQVSEEQRKERKPWVRGHRSAP